MTHDREEAVVTTRGVDRPPDRRRAPPRIRGRTRGATSMTGCAGAVMSRDPRRGPCGISELRHGSASACNNALARRTGTSSAPVWRPVGGKANPRMELVLAGQDGGLVRPEHAVAHREGGAVSAPPRRCRRDPHPRPGGRPRVRGDRGPTHPRRGLPIPPRPVRGTDHRARGRVAAARHLLGHRQAARPTRRSPSPPTTKPRCSSPSTPTSCRRGSSPRRSKPGSPRRLASKRGLHDACVELGVPVPRAVFPTSLGPRSQPSPRPSRSPSSRRTSNPSAASAPPR